MILLTSFFLIRDVKHPILFLVVVIVTCVGAGAGAGAYCYSLISFFKGMIDVISLETCEKSKLDGSLFLLI
jgi:hypothetical protein